MPKEETQFKKGNPGKPKGAKNKNNWESIDIGIRTAALSILKPFDDEAALKNIGNAIMKCAKDEPLEYIERLVFPLMNKFPPEMRVKIFSMMIGAGSLEEAQVMHDEMKLLLDGARKEGVDLVTYRERLLAEAGRPDRGD